MFINQISKQTQLLHATPYVALLQIPCFPGLADVTDPSSALEDDGADAEGKGSGQFWAPSWELLLMTHILHDPINTILPELQGF